jgi:hypothetical protein
MLICWLPDLTVCEICVPIMLGWITAALRIAKHSLLLDLNFKLAFFTHTFSPDPYDSILRAILPNPLIWKTFWNEISSISYYIQFTTHHLINHNHTTMVITDYQQLILFKAYD